jgi:dolichol kinase
MVVHLVWGTALALAYLAGVPLPWVIGVMAAALAALTAMEAIRLTYRRRPESDPMGLIARTYARLGRRFMRTHERRGDWVAALASVSGYLLVLIAFDKPTAVAGILAASLGDPAARLVGRRFGTVRLIRHKSLQGTLALGLVAWAAARALGFAWPVALGGSAGAVLADYASAFRPFDVAIDDNFLAPVAASLGIWAVGGLL